MEISEVCGGPRCPVHRFLRRTSFLRFGAAALLLLIYVFSLSGCPFSFADNQLSGEEMAALAEDYYSAYMNYASTGSESGMWAVLQKTVYGGDLYNYILGSKEAGTFFSRTTISYDVLEFTDPQMLSDTCFTCDITARGHCTAARWNDSYEFELNKDYVLVFSKAGGAWQASELNDITPAPESPLYTGHGIEILETASGHARGRLIKVADPKRVILGTMDNIGQQSGMFLTELLDKYGGIAGINAGGYDGSYSSAGTPNGLVIHNGEIVYGYPDFSYTVIGLDSDGILHVSDMTGRNAVESGILWGVSFRMHTGASGALIVDGEVQTGNLSGGTNPRTAIGQTESGELLLLVLDGRSVNTLGATLSDVVGIMLEYGAVNAGNLDGGASSAMAFNGELINDVSSATGALRMPDAFIVLGEDE